MEPIEFVIPRHAVPSDPHSGLSPLQERMLNEAAPIRIFSAPTGAGKSYAYQKGMRERDERVLFIVPTRRLAQNLAQGLVSDLMHDGVPEEKALEIQRKDIANVIRDRIIVEKSVAQEEERIKEVRQVSEADRSKQVAVIAAQAKAEEQGR